MQLRLMMAVLAIVFATSLVGAPPRVGAAPATTAKGERRKPQPLHATAGWLLVGRHQGGFHDVGVLAELQRGGALKAHSSRVACRVFRSRQPITRLRLSKPQRRFRVRGKPFSNEANTCVGQHTKLKPGHFVASRGAEMVPLQAKTLGSVERASTAAIALAAVRRAAPKLPLGQYTRRVEHRAIARAKRSFIVVRLAFTPKTSCKHSLCKVPGYCGEKERQSAFVLLDGVSKRVLYVDVRLGATKDNDRGHVHFVDALYPKGAHGPWLVLFNHACPSWDFELVAPDASGRYKRVAIGGRASTI